MTNNDTIFFHDTTPTTPSLNPPPYTKPPDDFRPLTLTPSSILYLAITTPHTDTFTLHGPSPSFSALLPLIHDITSNSPSAIDKLATLTHSAPDVWDTCVPNPSFEVSGFRTFVVEGQRGTYTVLSVFVEQNQGVRDVLPAPVFTVTRFGPLVHGFEGVGRLRRMREARGYAATGTLVGSFVRKGEAARAARGVMEWLLRGEGEVEVAREEGWGKDGGGVLLAMGDGKRWEVRVRYEDEALRRAREGADEEGVGVGWRF